MSDDLTRRSHPRVSTEDALLAYMVRDLQWLCDEVAPDIPGHRVPPEKLAALLDALHALEQGLRGYVRRRLADGIEADGR